MAEACSAQASGRRRSLDGRPSQRQELAPDHKHDGASAAADPSRRRRLQSCSPARCHCWERRNERQCRRPRQSAIRPHSRVRCHAGCCPRRGCWRSARRSAWLAAPFWCAAAACRCPASPCCLSGRPGQGASRRRWQKMHRLRRRRQSCCCRVPPCGRLAAEQRQPQQSRCSAAWTAASTAEEVVRPLRPQSLWDCATRARA
mmetsp:Transcript_3813/g.8638  ORF Transcript_3813/g.8638 Transcript_3813/m.8638 type:complete len:202 (-) Transcript_3813:1198-1803(-)